MPPTIMITIERTAAKIGRSMKNREKFTAFAGRGIDERAGANAGEAFHDDLFARFQPVVHDAALASPSVPG